MEADVDIFVRQPGLARERLRALLGAIETANQGRFISNRKLHRLLEASFSENWRAARDHVERVIDLLGEIISQRRARRGIRGRRLPTRGDPRP
jgi:hypothetical protein